MESNHNDIKNEAIRFARKNKKEIAKRLTNPQVFFPDQEPVSVFMAGSPGAGKTEASKALLDELENVEKGRKVLRIDPDELRSEFEHYSGDNAWLFQPAVSILVDKIHDLALKQRQSFILDGTLSNHDKALDNITRSIKKKRQVQILYVYQTPEQAWGFVKAREKAEGRLLKEIDGSRKLYKAGIDQTDNHIPEKYTRTDIEKLIGTQ